MSNKSSTFSLNAGISKVLMSSTALTSFILVLSSGASTQALAQAAKTADAAPVEEVVVTGSLVVRNGYQAPTPVTVVGAAELESAATVTLADTVNRMPAFANSVRPNSAAGSISQGVAGLNNLNLRGLGSTRTLVLMDGERVGGASFNNVYSNSGSVDVNVMPAGLVKRVDVVTGGASAAYGSDAVAGVVNFVLDHDFTGVKGNVEGGITTYGDDVSMRTELTAGFSFGGGRGHVTAYGSYSHSDEVMGNARPFQDDGYQLIPNLAYTATNGLPQYVATHHVGNATGAPGGVFTGTSSLAGITFGPSGTPYRIGGVVDGQWLIGGAWQDTRTDNSTSLAPELTLGSAFTRVGYDVTDNISVFVQALWTNTHTLQTAALPSAYLGSLSISSQNAYLPTSIRNAMLTAGPNGTALTSVPYGLTLIGGSGIAPVNDRNFARFSGGIDGKSNVFDTDWKWGASFEYSKNRISGRAYNDPITANLKQALDSVIGPDGSPVCRVQTGGCVPYNPFGTNVNSQAALNYVTGTGYQLVRLTQQAFDAHVSGNPFSLWAGPVSVAFGVDWRSEAVGGDSSTLDKQALTPAGAAFNFGNYLPSLGEYQVTEGFVETVIPLATGQSWAKSLELNAAVRATSYTTSGYVTTWKGGLTWQPIDDVRFRFTRSRDIRAPNLAELFSAGSFARPSITDPFKGNKQVVVTSPTTGNSSLQPEKADTTGVGVVLSPSFFPGFEASVDYFNIDINSAIANVGTTQYVALCYQGQTQYCSAITRDPTLNPQVFNGVVLGDITNVLSTGANIASVNEHGLDIEASYHFPMASLVSSWDGDMSIRFLGTEVFSFVNNSLGQITQGAGTVPGSGSGSGAPKFTANLSANYTLDALTAAITMRYIAPEKISNNYVQCTTGCPLSTPTNPTVDTNQVGSNTLVDLSTSYKLMDGAASVYGAVDNVFNTNPPLLLGTIGNGYLGNSFVSAPGYERLGRTFRAGVRFKM